MAKTTVVPFELPTEFSPDPLTEVIQADAQRDDRQCGKVPNRYPHKEERAPPKKREQEQHRSLNGAHRKDVAGCLF